MGNESKAIEEMLLTRLSIRNTTVRKRVTRHFHTFTFLNKPTATTAIRYNPPIFRYCAAPSVADASATGASG